jgi:hypothetical protein
VSMGTRIQTPDERDAKAEYVGIVMIVPTARGKWRIYEDATGYSQRSGQTIKRGKLVRRFDAECDYDGRPAEFDTLEQASAYALTLDRAELKARREMGF